MTGMSSDLSVTQNLYSSECVAAVPALCAGVDAAVHHPGPTGRGLIAADIGNQLERTEQIHTDTEGNGDGAR